MYLYRPIPATGVHAPVPALCFLEAALIQGIHARRHGPEVHLTVVQSIVVALWLDSSSLGDSLQDRPFSFDQIAFLFPDVAALWTLPIAMGTPTAWVKIK